MANTRSVGRDGGDFHAMHSHLRLFNVCLLHSLSNPTMIQPERGKIRRVSLSLALCLSLSLSSRSTPSKLQSGKRHQQTEGESPSYSRGIETRAPAYDEPGGRRGSGRVQQGKGACTLLVQQCVGRVRLTPLTCPAILIHRSRCVLSRSEMVEDA